MIHLTLKKKIKGNSNSKSGSACGLLDLYRSQGLIDDVSVTLNTGVSGGFVCLEAGSKLVVSGSNFESNIIFSFQNNKNK